MPRTSTWIKGFSASTLSLGDGAARAALPRPLCRLSQRARPDHGQPGVGARRRPGGLCDRAPRPATAAAPRVARPVGLADRLPAPPPPGVGQIAYRLALRERSSRRMGELPDCLTFVDEERDPTLAEALRSLPP